jgi:hypothetical protein
MATPNLGLLVLTESQEDKELTVNENFYTLDAIIQGVLGQQNTPPGSPAAGDAYIVTATASGLWAGQENKIAYYFNGGWSFITPSTGLAVFSLSQAVLVYFNGTTWASGSASIGLTMPTGFSVSGSPTSTGTIAVTFTSGYSLPTTTSQNEWNTAYDWGFGFPSLPSNFGSVVHNSVYRVRNSGRSLTLTNIATDGFTFTTIPDSNKYTWTATASGTNFYDKNGDPVTSPVSVAGSANFVYDLTANQWVIIS